MLLLCSRSWCRCGGVVDASVEEAAAAVDAAEGAAKNEAVDTAAAAVATEKQNRQEL